MTAPTDTTTETVAEDRPVRFCHGCTKWDSHPRAMAIPDRGNPALTSCTTTTVYRPSTSNSTR